MKEWRRIQRNKAYSFYVKSKKYKKHKKFVRPAFILDSDGYDIIVNRYYFTDVTDKDCIYVDKQITTKYGKIFKQTVIMRDTAWDDTSVFRIWSRWH